MMCCRGGCHTIFKLLGNIRHKDEGWDLSEATPVVTGIGDVRITIPPDLPVLVRGVMGIGERQVLHRRDDGLFHGADVRDPQTISIDAPALLEIAVCTLIGDPHVERVA